MGNNIIIYNTADGKASVSLLSKDGTVWMNQNQLAELFDTSVANISMHIANILKDNELHKNSVVKDYLTTATDGKEYHVTFYALNYLIEDEIYNLNRFVVVFLETAELREKTAKCSA